MSNPSATPIQSRPRMSEAEMAARAIARARTEHVHIRATARPGVYVTCSKSEPGVRYNLVVSGELVACSCRGFEFRKVCKHSEQLKSRLAREAKKPAPVLTGPAIVKGGACVCALYDVERPCSSCGR